MAVSSVKKLYQNVIDDVISNVRDVFLDDGVDEQVLSELKQVWERKLRDSKAVEDENKDGQQLGLNQSSNNGQSVITQNSNTVQRSNQNSGNANRNTTYNVREAQLINQNQQQPQFHVQQLATAQSQPQQGRQMHQPQQMHPQVSQAAAVTATRQLASTSSPLTQQLTLAPGSLVQPTLFQYATADGVDGQKTLTLLPQKVTFAFSNPPVMSSSAAAATLALPPELTASLFQQLPNVLNVTQAQTSVVQHTNQTNTVNSGNQVQFQSSNPATVPNQQSATVNNRAPPASRIVQLDGPNDSSDDDEDDDDFPDNDDDHEENDEEQNEDENEDPGEEEEPLNSGDDVSDEDPIELFDTDNVVVCQYDKITRSRNKWKFHLKDGIMNLQNKDYVFQKAIGDAEW